jgi:hypothetical protein
MWLVVVERRVLTPSNSNCSKQEGGKVNSSYVHSRGKEQGEGRSSNQNFININSSSGRIASQKRQLQA